MQNGGRDLPKPSLGAQVNLIIKNKFILDYARKRKSKKKW